MVRRVLRSGVVAVAAAGVAVLAFTGVGRASGLPSIERPLAPAVREVPTVLAASASPTPAPAPAPAAVDPAPVAVDPVEPAPVDAAAVPEPAAAPEPAAVPEPAAAPEPAGEVVVLCSVGEGGAFVPVASPSDCPGSAAMRMERTPVGG